MINATRVDHVGIAVKNLDEMVKFYEDTLGLKAKGTETVEEQKVTVAFLPCGDSELELLESTTDDGPIAKFIEKNGEGIQHVAIRVDDIDAALVELKERESVSSTRPPATAPATPASPSSIPRPPAACSWSSPSGCNEVKA